MEVICVDFADESLLNGMSGSIQFWISGSYLGLLRDYAIRSCKQE